MRRAFILIISICEAIILASCAITDNAAPVPSVAPAPSIPVPEGWALLWSDEFDGGGLSGVWNYQEGTGESEGLTYWGNEEKQYYKRDNARVEDGLLKITARKEREGGMAYTSARLNTNGNFSFTYGRVEARIKNPAVTGLWPAFWMLPTDSPYGVWAASGEIDVMEFKGAYPGETSAALHYGGQWPKNTYANGFYYFPAGETAEDFHVYALEWSEEGGLEWFVDGNSFFSMTSWPTAGADGGSLPGNAPFNTDFHILLNMAVGGGFSAHLLPPEDFTEAEMQVDYVRVYSRL